MEQTNHKPFYDINLDEKYGKIIYQEKEYILDIIDLFLIINYEKNFNFYNTDDIYPSFIRHNNNITYLEFIYKFNKDYTDYQFLNNNIYDLRKDNVKFYHKYHKDIINKYPNAVYFVGHYSSLGKDAYIMKNPYWIINENNKDIYLMYCEENTICKLDINSMNKIQEFEKQNNNKKLTFYKHTNGYILCSNHNLFIHQIITNCYGNGKGTKNVSVDHIDQDPLNNCYDNLRIATREEQENNCKGIKEGTKRERKHSAKELPEGIAHDMMRKYVVYYKECYNKEKDLWREFFKIEKHPKLDKPWMSSKSTKISALEKLKQTNKVSEDLENDIQPEPSKTLPLYISINNFRNKPHLVYDKRDTDGTRQNLRMILPTDYIIEEQIKLFEEKIQEKYN
jgi:hypothetical protein